MPEGLLIQMEQYQRNLWLAFQGVSTSAGNAGGTTVVDSVLTAFATDLFNDHFSIVIIDSGSSSYGEIRQIIDFDGTSTLTVDRAFSAQIATATNYIIRRDPYSIQGSNSADNQVDTTAVVPNVDGSLVERMEHIKELIEQGLLLFDNFSDEEQYNDALDTNVWGQTDSDGNHTTTYDSSNSRAEMDGDTTVGSTFLRSVEKFNTPCVFSAKLTPTTLTETDGEVYPSIMLYNGANQWVRFGPYKESGGEDSVGFIKFSDAGDNDQEVDVITTNTDALQREYAIALVDEKAMFYINGDLVYQMSFTGMTDFYADLICSTSHVNCAYVDIFWTDAMVETWDAVVGKRLLHNFNHISMNNRESYYVDDANGDDNFSGEHPDYARKTVTSGYGLCGSGDSLVISPGLYTEDINFNTDGVTVIGGGSGDGTNAGTVISGHSTMTCMGNQFINVDFTDADGIVIVIGNDANGTYNTFDDCRIAATGTATNAIHIDGTNGGDYNTVKDCFINGGTASTILLNSGATISNTFKDCVIKSDGTGGHGIHINHADADDNTFDHCIIQGDGSTGTGIYVQAGTENHFYDCSVDDFTTNYSVIASNHMLRNSVGGTHLATGKSIPDALGTDGTTVTDSAVSVLGAIGANNAGNAFASGSVTEDADGSLLERLEYIQNHVIPDISGLAWLGIVTTADTTSSWTATGLIGKGTNVFNDNYYIQFIEADNAAPEGEVQKVSAYNTATGVFSVAVAYSVAPAAGDQFIVYHESLVMNGRDDANNIFASTNVTVNNDGSIIERVEGILSQCRSKGYTGDIYYVGTGGSDSNDGLSIATAFLTINYAITQCTTANDDVIIVLAGSFDQTAAGVNGAALNKNSVHLFGLGSGSTVLQNSNGAAVYVIYITGTDCEVAGFEIWEDTNTVEGVYIGGLNTTVHNMIFRSAMENGIQLSSVYSEIYNCKFYSITNDGIEVNTTVSFIHDNLFLQCGDNAIHVNNDYNTIIDNYIVGAGTTTTGITLTANADWTLLVNNRITGCTNEIVDGGTNNDPINAARMIGANNANNAFDSSTVVANPDGSLFERLEDISGVLADIGGLAAYGVVTTATSDTQVKVLGLAGKGTNIFNDRYYCQIIEADNAAPEGETRKISAYDTSDGDFTVGVAFSVAPDVGDIVLILHESLALMFIHADATLASVEDDSIIAHILAVDGTTADYNDNTMSLEALNVDLDAVIVGTVTNATGADVATDVVALQTDLGNPSVRANSATIEAMLGNADTANITLAGIIGGEYVNNNGNPDVDNIRAHLRAGLVNGTGTVLPANKSIYDILGVTYVDGGGAFNVDSIWDDLRTVGQYLIDGTAGAELGTVLPAGKSLYDVLIDGTAKNLMVNHDMPWLSEFWWNESIDGTVWETIIDGTGTEAFAVSDGYMYYDMDTQNLADADVFLNSKYRWRCRPASFSDANSTIEKLVLEWVARTTGNIADVTNANFVMGFAETKDNDNTDNNIAVFTLVGDALTARTDDDGAADEDTAPGGETLSNWNKYRIEVYDTGYKFYLNEALIATHTVRVPDEAMYIVFGTRSDGVGAVGLEIDNVKCYYYEVV